MRHVIIAAAMLFTALFAYVPSAQAAGVVFGENNICSDAKTGSSDSCQTTTANPVNSLLGRAVDFAILIAGAIAAIFVIVGGIRYILAQDDPGALQAARDTIVYALAGLLIAVFCKQIASWAITKF